METNGPNQVPCGIEPFKVRQDEKYSDNLTHRMRLIKKKHNKRINN